jgi:hypothetical protein
MEKETGGLHLCVWRYVTVVHFRIAQLGMLHGAACNLACDYFVAMYIH